MKIYNYSAMTGEFLSTADAHPSPLEPAKFLIPACATAVAPPQTSEHEAAVYVENSGWKIVPDYRGVLRYSTTDGSEVKVEELGVLPEEMPDTTDAPRPSEFHVYYENAWELDEAAFYAAKLAQFTGIIQARLDAFAQTRNYDNILSAASYATSQNPVFSVEGQYAVIARDNTWARAYEILAEFESGERKMPMEEELFKLLPALEWPV
jgi:hypothetical protein